MLVNKLNVHKCAMRPSSFTTSSDDCAGPVSMSTGLGAYRRIRLRVNESMSQY